MHKWIETSEVYKQLPYKDPEELYMHLIAIAGTANEAG